VLLVDGGKFAFGLELVLPDAVAVLAVEGLDQEDGLAAFGVLFGPGPERLLRLRFVAAGERRVRALAPLAASDLRGHVDAIAVDHRRGDAEPAERGLPRHVLRAPARREARLRGDAVGVRSPPLRPVLGAARAEGGDEGGEDDDDGDPGAHGTSFRAGPFKHNDAFQSDPPAGGVPASVMALLPPLLPPIRHRTARVPFLVLLVVLAPCVVAARPQAPPARKASAPQATAPDPVARRLCDALHALPARRKAECCGASAESLADLCASEVTASLRRGAVTVDGAAVDRCGAETARDLEGCGWVAPQPPPLPAACRVLVQGTLAAGASCRSSLECREGLFCRGAGPETPGTCARPAPARTRCEVPADNLASYVRAGDDPRHPACDGLCIKGECLPFAPAGASCASSSGCVPGLHCVVGVCQDRELPKVGEACAGRTSCGAGAFCQDGRCRPQKAAGEACTLSSECRALACVKAKGATVGKCGEPCGPSRGSP
jgi:hypothetical protein